MEQTVKNSMRYVDRIRYALKRYRGITIETDLTPYNRILEKTNLIDYHDSRDGQLKGAYADLKRRAGAGTPLDTLLPEAFALIKEAVKRTLSITAYDEQIAAGIVLHQSKLAQMRTGEGKTLAAVFPAFLNALTGRGVHVLTANEYLARRDAGWMGEVYAFLGQSALSVSEKMDSNEKRKSYQADITYLTAKQAGFDFLFDCLQYSSDDQVQKPFHMAIVDEADFIMIDEARVPLVIAREKCRTEIDPVEIDTAVRKLRKGLHFTIDRNRRNCFLTLEGESYIRRLLRCGGTHEESSFQQFAAVNVSLHAHYLLIRDVDYIEKQGRIELIDEFTGRVAEKRRWPYGIQSALEAKEGVKIQAEGEVCGSITVQHFLGQYPKIAAMTATAVSAADELKEFYGLNTVIIPPHVPDRKEHLPDSIFPTLQTKLPVLIEEIQKTHETGRPVLVGTKSVRESEELSEALSSSGIPHEVLNAKNDEKEAAVIAKAGMLGAVTISTNMAGRGIDIRLGGPDGAHQDRIVELGGLYVLGTNRHESVRIDDQLRGRAGRQGDPGTSRFIISLEDDLIKRYGILDSQDPVISDPAAGLREVARAQRIIEFQHFEMRRTLRRYSEFVEKQRQGLQTLRRDALFERLLPETLLDRCKIKFEDFDSHQKADSASRLLTALFVRSLDTFWSRHLAWIDDIREGLHLRRLGRQDPFLEFIRDAAAAFDEGLEAAIAETAESFRDIDILEAVLDEMETALTRPANTWTYLINDDPFPFFKVSLFDKTLAKKALDSLRAVLLAPIFILSGIVELIRRCLNRRG